MVRDRGRGGFRRGREIARPASRGRRARRDDRRRGERHDALHGRGPRRREASRRAHRRHRQQRGRAASRGERASDPRRDRRGGDRRLDPDEGRHGAEDRAQPVLDRRDGAPWPRLQGHDGRFSRHQREAATAQRSDGGEDRELRRRARQRGAHRSRRRGEARCPRRARHLTGRGESAARPPRRQFAPRASRAPEGETGDR